MQILFFMILLYAISITPNNELQADLEMILGG